MKIKTLTKGALISLLFAVPIFIQSCGGGGADTSSAPVDPVATAPTEPTPPGGPSVTPPPIDPTGTGDVSPEMHNAPISVIALTDGIKESVVPIVMEEIVKEEPAEEPIQLAQNEPPRRGYPGNGRYQPPELKVEAKGETSDAIITLAIDKPPYEFNACVGGMKIVNNVLPMASDSFKYESWWLVASTTGINRLTPEAPVYFYWARQIAKDEIGIVPANFSTSKINKDLPEDAKIDTGFAQLPYIWASNIHAYEGIPMIPSECRKA